MIQKLSIEIKIRHTEFVIWRTLFVATEINVACEVETFFKPYFHHIELVLYET